MDTSNSNLVLAENLLSNRELKLKTKFLQVLRAYQALMPLVRA